MGREEPAVGNEVRKELRLKVVNRRQMRLRAVDVEKLIMVPNRLATAAAHRPGLNLAGLPRPKSKGNWDALTVLNPALAAESSLTSSIIPQLLCVGMTVL